jgi:hypothetical protein
MLISHLMFAALSPINGDAWAKCCIIQAQPTCRLQPTAEFPGAIKPFDTTRMRCRVPRMLQESGSLRDAVITLSTCEFIKAERKPEITSRAGSCVTFKIREIYLLLQNKLGKTGTSRGTPRCRDTLQYHTTYSVPSIGQVPQRSAGIPLRVQSLLHP